MKSIDQRDVVNLMRHAFLLGMGTKPEDIDDQDGFFAELLAEYEKDGYMGYNDLCGSCEDDKRCGWT